MLNFYPEFRKAQSRVWVSFFRQFTLLNIVGQFHKRWQKNLFNRAGWETCYAYSLPMTSAFRRVTDFGNRRFHHKRNSIFTIGRQRRMCFFVPQKGHPYPALAITGIVTLFKNLAKFGINAGDIKYSLACSSISLIILSDRYTGR